MKIIEFFAGSRSFGKEAEKRGHEVFSIDIEDFGGIDMVADISKIWKEDLPFYPDGMWSGVPCTTYSIAAIGHHRNGQTPKTEEAKLADALTMHTIKLMHQFPKSIWALENPRGMLRKMDFMKPYERRTVTYCSYGDSRMKPTDIWGNFFFSLYNQDGWNPKPLCFNNNKKCHHDSSPRSSTIRKAKEKGVYIPVLGTTGLKNNHERSKMPPELCVEIIKNWEKQIEISKSFDIFGLSK